MKTSTRAAIGLACGVLGFFAGTYVQYSRMSRMPFFGEYVTIVSGGLVDRGLFAPDLKVAGAEAITREALDSLVKANPDLSREEAFFELMRRNGIGLGFRRLLWPGVLGFLVALAISLVGLIWWPRRPAAAGHSEPPG